MSDLAPILLRPPADLAAAMTRAADAEGVSRQVWMLGVLRLAADPFFTIEPHPDDLPLFPTEGETPS